MTERHGRVEGKVAIVTGAGSTPGDGIGTGRAIAIMLAREGANVLLVDRIGDRAEETRKMIEAEAGTADVFEADLRRATDCQAMVSAAVERFGVPDILVNNIGVGLQGSVVDLTEEQWNSQLESNLTTFFLTSKYVVPLMAQSGRGSIVNISSISALRGDGSIGYSAAKGGVLAATVDMAFCHGRQGIRVNAIVPGHLKTPMSQAALAAIEVSPAALDYTNRMRNEAGLLGTEGNGWDVAYATLFLASDEARWITGVTLPVDAGVLTVTPLMWAPILRAVPAP